MEQDGLLGSPAAKEAPVVSQFVMDKRPDTMSNKVSQYVAASAANLCALACGVALGWPSPGIEKLLHSDTTVLDYVISEDQKSWVGSLIALGAALGPFPAGYTADRFGRKATMLTFMVPFLMAWFLMVTTDKILNIYAARLLLGIGVGGVFTALPMYIGEISEDSIRGSLGSLMQLFITVGMLISYAIGPYVSFFWLGMVCYAIPIMFLVIFMWYPESPYYLVAAGKRELAKEALVKLRGLSRDALEKELDIMKATADATSSSQGGMRDCLATPAARRALLLSLGLVAGQQLAGINVVLFYTQTIFDAAGGELPSAEAVILVGAVQMLSSFVTPLVVERAGRRLLLLGSGLGMAVTLAALGVYFYLLSNGSDVSSISFLPVVSLVAYMIFYCLGFGPLPWAVMGELFTPEIKSVASTATASFCWFLGFVITKFFGSVSDVLGMSGAFWIFAGFCVAFSGFVYMLLPETKGKSAQEIQAALGGRGK